MKKRVFNLIIVDESGSMSCIQRQTVNGLNETLQTVRMVQNDNPEQEHLVSVIFFNSGGVRTLYNAAPANDAKDIESKDYQPGGCTPLYDAVGNGITELRKHVAPADSVLVTIITDGEENSSREYNHRAICALIEDMKKQDWVFTFIGANIDVERTSADLGINCCMAFVQDEVGTKHMWERERRSRRGFFAKLSERMSARPTECKMSDLADKEGYFEKEEGEK